MIELLNRYRLAKDQSEKAARELGFTFGEHWEVKNRDTPEYAAKEFDDLCLANLPKIVNLFAKFPGSNCKQAFSGLLEADSNGRWTIGIHNTPMSEIVGSVMRLDEAPFVEGFIEGFRNSRKLATLG